MSLVEASAMGRLASHLLYVPWSNADLVEAAREAPHVRVGPINQEVVECDVALNAAFWRILSLIDPLRFEPGKRDFAHFYSALRPRVSEEFNISLDDARKPARDIAKFLDAEMRRSGTKSQRGSVSGSTKTTLLDQCGIEPYCWYCGFRFSSSAVDVFLGGERVSEERAWYVDFTAPRGVLPRDRRIEIDHLVPVKRGGSDDLSNLRLACGWCNSHKSALSVLIDAPSYPKRWQHPVLGELFVPVPYWVIRVLGSRRRCDAEGCQLTPEVSQMVVGPFDRAGALVPGNLGTFCMEHDPLEDVRKVPSRLIRG